METKYELRASFGDAACDIVATEDDGHFYLEQDDVLIVLPKEWAVDFIKKLGDWISYGRNA